MQVIIFEFFTVQYDFPINTCKCRILFSQNSYNFIGSNWRLWRLPSHCTWKLFSALLEIYWHPMALAEPIFVIPPREKFHHKIHRSRGLLKSQHLEQRISNTDMRFLIWCTAITVTEQEDVTKRVNGDKNKYCRKSKRNADQSQEMETIMMI